MSLHTKTSALRELTPAQLKLVSGGGPLDINNHDTDGDGFLSFSEVQAVYEDVTQEFFDDKDVDADGQLNGDEVDRFNSDIITVTAPGGGGGGGDDVDLWPDDPTDPIDPYGDDGDDPGGHGGGGGPDAACAGYDGDGDGQNDAVPNDISEIRNDVNQFASELAALSQSYGDTFGTGQDFAEYGAFIVKDMFGNVTIREAFTDGDTNSVNADFETLRPFDTVIGYIHSHPLGNNASDTDLTNMQGIIGLIDGTSLYDVDSNLVLYIVDPNGQVAEFTRDVQLQGGDNVQGQDLSAIGNGGC